MKFLNILSVCTIFLSFGVSKAIGNDLDEVICNAMKGMQVQEEKHINIQYLVGENGVLRMIVNCLC